MSISDLYRYPVKGLAPQKLDQAKLTPGQTMPFDRAESPQNSAIFS
jgi:uncharacterized protein YcbX